MVSVDLINTYFLQTQVAPPDQLIQSCSLDMKTSPLGIRLEHNMSYTLRIHLMDIHVTLLYITTMSPTNLTLEFVKKDATYSCLYIMPDII